MGRGCRRIRRAAPPTLISFVSFYRSIGRRLTALMTPARNVLIFHSGALGDVVLSLSVGLAAARIFPQSRVIYVTANQKGRLAAELLGVEHLDIESGWPALHGEGELPEHVARCLAKTHTVISFLGAGGQWTKRVTAAGADGMRFIKLSTRPSADYRASLTTFWQSELKAAGHTALAAGLDQIVKLIQTRGLRLPGKPERNSSNSVVVHPGSGGVSKCWPLAGFLELAGMLRKSGRAVTLVIGEAERDRWDPAQLEALASTGTLCEPASLLQLAQLLSSAGGYVGNDSGPSHLAGVLGVPSVVLFGPTDEAVWKPLGPKVATLSAIPMQGITPASVLMSLAACQR